MNKFKKYAIFFLILLTILWYKSPVSYASQNLTIWNTWSQVTEIKTGGTFQLPPVNPTGTGTKIIINTSEKVTLIGTKSDGYSYLAIEYKCSNANLTISNLKVQSIYVPALKFIGENNHLFFTGGNKLNGSTYYPGISVEGETTLEISGDGKLDVFGGAYAAGIGAGNANKTGTIIINSGTITAQGGERGAGIGTSGHQTGGNVIINGGTITATGGTDAAGIGGGLYGRTDSIYINGGNISATGKSTSAGIGGGNNSSGGLINITGGVDLNKIWSSPSQIITTDVKYYYGVKIGDGSTDYSAPRNTSLNNLYIVNFNNGAGKEQSLAYVTSNADAKLPSKELLNSLSKDGSFSPNNNVILLWKDSNGQFYNGSSFDTSINKSFTAFWGYNVELVTNNAEPNTNFVAESDKKLIDEIQLSPKKAGFLFDGWYLDADLTIPLSADYKVSKDITLYAKWTPYVDVYFWDGTNNVKSQVALGQKITEPSAPVQDKYTFGGWYTDSTRTHAMDFNTPITQGIQLYAKWIPYVVDVYFWDGTNNDKVQVAPGQKITEPSAPVQDKYTFGGWYTDSTRTHAMDFNTPITQGIQLYAKWIPYVVDVYFWDGTNNDKVQVAPGQKITEPFAPVQDKYTFGGWYTDSTRTHAMDFNTPITQGIQLYAKWIPYVVDVYFWDGTNNVKSQVAPGQKITEPSAPVRDNYAFGGWYTDSARTHAMDFNTPITQGMQLYAKWIPYVVDVYFWDGANNVKVQVAPGQKITEPSAPVKDNYTFQGWYTDSARTNAMDFNAPITQGIQLYAKWIPHVVDVYFWDGTNNVKVQVAPGQKITEPSAPVKDNYAFGGWYTDSARTNAMDFNTPITQGIQLYAKWIPYVDVYF
ncbi:InlB B-repeat-containing protein [Neobacillus rhizophilus]|uniref:InlB B-repeat-containing protein n=1 Tax=Neobacillus rhizophilus TaxID=2833579 RepID=A0A942U183_9BACI|nr:InlB B-repeat-containing protein [Neobacillus rhizophilus]MBS4212691.1 InlB B-repeat-containing protein [Neobacillus rhizophilus]